MNYYRDVNEVEPPFTMGQMQEISHDDALWTSFLYQTQRYRNKWFVYGAICGTVFVGLLQLLWGMIT